MFSSYKFHVPSELSHSLALMDPLFGRTGLAIQSPQLPAAIDIEAGYPGNIATELVSKTTVKPWADVTVASSSQTPHTLTPRTQQERILPMLKGRMVKNLMLLAGSKILTIRL